MKNILTSIVISLFMLNSCSQYDCNHIATEQTLISPDGKIKVELGSNSDAMKFKITNISSEEISIDKDMVFFLDISLVAKDGRKIMPSILYDKDIHGDVHCLESYFDGFDESKVVLSKAIVRLKSGDSLCKIYYADQLIYSHQLAFSFEGSSSISRYAWKLPSFREIKMVSLRYDSWDSRILNVIANSTDQRVPENLYHGKFQIDWLNE